MSYTAQPLPQSGANFYPLSQLKGAAIDRLPVSIKVLLECAMRCCDGFVVNEQHVAALANWSPNPAGERSEIPFKPARVVLQDFTGVPAVVDLATMRDAVKRLGGDPQKINPLIPCDLVVDHSVQVDYFGRPDALALNEKEEFSRNRERYELLKWAQRAFRNFRVVPPSTGIVHQVNLEHLSTVVFHNKEKNVLYPDSCIGTDSHTPMVNGLGVLAWGVGGIEAEAAMLDQPLYMLIPDVIGVKLTGQLPEGTTPTDLVLRITQMLRKEGVVEKFVEFFGPGVSALSLADRATIGNMAPEQGSTVSFFPVDDETLRYMRMTGRSEELIGTVERYWKEQGMFRTDATPDPIFTKTVELDLSTIEPAVAGPKRPHDRISLKKVGPTFAETLTAPVSASTGYGMTPEQLGTSTTISIDGKNETLAHGSVVIAAITSCTNTSNPTVMIGAGLLAKKAVERGLTVPGYVKTSLAPGSTVVTEYLKKAGVLEALEALRFHVVGYGCTTCIGNSGPLPEPVSKAIKEKKLCTAAVLSGNRNFEGRVNPLTQLNYLASPPLVVAYALFGTVAKDITTDPIGTGKDGKPVYLRDIWPSTKEIQETIARSVEPAIFKERYARVWEGSKAWQEIAAVESQLFAWQDSSTYVQRPPFFDGLARGKKSAIASLKGMKVLGVFGHSITTDHISPAGNIAGDSPAAKYLTSLGVPPKEFNSYGARRGNDRVMVRGTFANIRIKNQLVGGKEGNLTIHHPTGETVSFFDAADRYAKEGTPLIILAGKDYGSGSSRDWAAKGPFLMGVKAAIAESFERIHRSNLVGMGILPLQFKNGDTVESLGLTGSETFEVPLNDTLVPGGDLKVIATRKDGTTKEFTVRCRVDTPVEVQYFRDGGILQTVLLQRLG